MADKEEKKEDVVKKIDADVKEEKKVETTGKPKRREGRGPPKERSFDNSRCSFKYHQSSSFNQSMFCVLGVSSFHLEVGLHPLKTS